MGAPLDEAGWYSNLQAIAVLIPCHNEETSVGTVVRNLSTAIPEADIYVYDNDSSDRTTVVARVLVCHESMQGNRRRCLFIDRWRCDLLIPAVRTL